MRRLVPLCTLLLSPVSLAGQEPAPRDTIVIDDPCDFTINNEFNPGCEPTDPPSGPGGGSGGGSSGGGAGSGGGGTGGSGGTSDPNFTLWQTDVEDTNPFDLDDLTDCFNLTNNDGLVHTITVLIDQPVAGSDALMGSHSDVGHVWVELEQRGANAGGPSVRKNFGLYPVRNNTITGLGRLGTEEMKPYDVSVTYELSPTEFATLIDKIQDMGVPNYHAYSYNCTDYALDVLQHAGFNPGDADVYFNTMTSFGYLHVSAPGALGETIRTAPPLDALDYTVDGGVGRENTLCAEELEEVQPERE